jgi:hypothetical protein
MTRRRAEPDRLVPAGVFVLALAWHWLQGRWLPTPVLLPDELRAADGARAIAGGARSGAQSLYSLTSAPLWLGGVGTGYALAKLGGAVLVAAASWPAYRLARLGAGPALSGFAAAIAVLAPATLAASLIGGLALAYPVAALATLWLARYLGSGEARSGAASLAGFAIAAAAWPPLVLLLLAAVIAVAARSFEARSLARWPGAAALIAVPALVYAGYYTARAASPAFALVADGGWRDLPRSSLAGFGAFALGLGVLPAIAAFGAALDRRRPVRLPIGGFFVVGCVLLALAGAIEAANAPGPGTRVVELTLLPILPALAALAANALTRPYPRPAMLAVGAVATLAVAAVPRAVSDGFEPRAPGLELARRLGSTPWAWWLTIAIAVALVALGPRVVGIKGGWRRRTALLVALVLVAVAAGEVAAGASARREARATLRSSPRTLPTGSSSVAVLADGPVDRRTATLLFWNPHAEIVEPPLPARQIDPLTGTITPSLPSSDYVLDTAGARVSGAIVARTPAGTLIRPSPPSQAAETVQGLYPDGWSGAQATYRRFSVHGPGGVQVTASRRAWSGAPVPGHVTVLIGPLDRTPRVAAQFVLGRQAERTLLLKAPSQPFQVIVQSETFVPARYGASDPRALGVQLSFRYQAAG